MFVVITLYCLALFLCHVSCVRNRTMRGLSLQTMTRWNAVGAGLMTAPEMAEPHPLTPSRRSCLSSLSVTLLHGVRGKIFDVYTHTHTHTHAHTHTHTHTHTNTMCCDFLNWCRWHSPPCSRGKSLLPTDDPVWRAHSIGCLLLLRLPFYPHRQG